MAGIVFNNNYTTGIALTDPNTQNPATINTGVTVTNTGATYNGDAVYGKAGTAWSVTNLGLVAATAPTGIGVYLASGGNVTNGASGAGALISSSFIGVEIASVFGTAVNYGVITGALSGTVGAGVYLGNGGVVVNQTGALITASRAAVLAANNVATVANFGTIQSGDTSGTATNAAVALRSGGTVTNAGLIAAPAAGGAGAGGIGIAVQSTNGGAVVNTAGALVRGYQSGIDFLSGFGTVANLGTVVSLSTGAFASVYMNTGGIVVNGAANNTTALIAGTSRAIQFNTTAPAASSVGTVVNFGTVASAPTGTSGAGIELDFGGLVINGSGASTNALIASSRTAVRFAGLSGTLNNFGTIADSGAGAAVYLGASGNITNGASNAAVGLIIGAAMGISAKNSAANITNFGTIVSTATAFPGAGVYMSGGGSLTNAAGGLITAKQSALSVFTNSANLTNDGTVASTGATAAAVYLGHGGTVTNGASVSTALISGNGDGVFIKNGFGLIDNLGTLVNGGAGVGVGAYLSSGGAVVNGSTAAPSALIASSGGGIFTAHVFATVVNFGTIASTSHGTSGVGIYLFGAGGFISNQAGGLIATYKTAVEAIAFGNASGTLSNNGVIENSGTAPTLYFTTFAAITNAAGATIENTSTGAAVGLNTVGTVVNNGLIASVAGPAVSIGGGPAGGAAIITLDNNATISGKSGVVISPLDHGFNTLVNYGTVTATNGPAFAFGGGDDTLVDEPGSVLNGAIANFHPGSRIDFANQTVTSVTFSNSTGLLTLLNGNATVATLTLTGSFDPAQFALGSDSNGGTNLTLNAPPQLFAPAQLALASFGAAAGGWTSQNIYPRLLKDVTGDGLADIVGFGAAGAYVSVNTGNGNFATPALGVANFGSSPAGGGWTTQDAYPRELADVNGDGVADIVGFGAGGVYTSLATGGGNFAAASLAISAFGQAGGWNSQDVYPREMADVNGDGKADIVAFGDAGVYVSYNLGNGQFAQPALALQAFTPGAGWTSQQQFPRLLADVTGDGLPDIVGFGATGVWVARNLGNGQFAQPTLTLQAFGQAGGWTGQDLDPRELADVNGDGMADIVGFGSNGVWVAQATGNGNFAQPVFGFNDFGSSAVGGGWTSQDTYPRLLADVTGDKKADIVGFGSNGVFVAPSLDPLAGAMLA